MMVSEFVTIMSISPINHVIEKKWFGKKYARVGPLFIIAGMWLFQQGGMLGYGLQEDPTILEKLLTGKRSGGNLMNSLKGSADPYIDRARTRHNTFYHIYAAPELHDQGVNIGNWPPDESWNLQVDLDVVKTISSIAFIEGATFAYHFPSHFTQCWTGTYRDSSIAIMEDLSRLGLEPLHAHETSSFSERVSQVASLAAGWSSHLPGLLDAKESAILESVALQGFTTQ